MTKIIAAAVRLPNGKVVSLPPPARHHDVIHYICQADALDRLPADCEQGFLLDDGRFARRVAALHIAFAAGQVLGGKLKGGRVLTSEDLW